MTNPALRRLIIVINGSLTMLFAGKGVKENLCCKRNFAKCDFAVTDFLSIEMCTVSPGPTMFVC